MTQPGEKINCEIRCSHYREKPCAPVLRRIDEVYEQRLYVVSRKLIGDIGDPVSCEFNVLGTTGNVYTVKLEKRPSCTCPDFSHGYLCKHILFVYLRELKLSRNNPCIWQRGLLSSELEAILHKCATIPRRFTASRKVRRKFEKITHQHKQRAVNGNCPICYEPMAARDAKMLDPVVFCKICGNNVHEKCFMKWRKGKIREDVTCISCRALWKDEYLEARNKEYANSEGYINLASCM